MSSLANWDSTGSSLNSALTFTSCSMSGSNAIAVGQKNNTTGVIYYSGDSGKTWSVCTLRGTTAKVVTSCSMSGANAIAVGTTYSNNYVFTCYSTDSGKTWTFKEIFARNINSCFMSGSNAIAAGRIQISGINRGVIYYSDSSGVNWSLATGDFSGAIRLRSCYMSGKYAIAIGENTTETNGVIYYSDSSGVTWSLATDTGNFSGSKVFNSCFMSGKYAIAVGQNNTNGVIYYSDDYGETWDIVTPPLTLSSMLNSCYILGTNAIAVGQNGSSAGAIYYSQPPPLPCFKSDSKILTDKGYVQVQDLRKGDLVKTLKDGYKPIELIGKSDIYHSASQERIKNQLYKCSQSEYPELFEDLVITGCHCILMDNFIDEEQREKTIEVNGKIYVTDSKYRVPACVDQRASIYETPGTYTIYHLALENENYYGNYGVYANGLLVETCSKRYLSELSNMKLIE